MHQLQCASQPASLDSVASEERVLSTACSILAQRSIVDLQRGAFVRLALGRFSHALSALKGLTPGLHHLSRPDTHAPDWQVGMCGGSQHQQQQCLESFYVPQCNRTSFHIIRDFCLAADLEVDQVAKEDLVRMIDSNLARCLQLLYGITLPHRNIEWGASDVSTSALLQPFYWYW